MADDCKPAEGDARAEDTTPAEEEEPPPVEEKLHLGEKVLERFVQELVDAPPKLQSLRDEVVHLGRDLHNALKEVNDCEVAIGDMDSEIMSTAYEQSAIDEQIAELPPEQARMRKATAASTKATEQLEKEYADDLDAKAFFEAEIAALERAVGLGAGWTQGQLAKQRLLQRQIDELEVDKERRQQELDQVRRETAAGKEATGRHQAALAAMEEEIAANQAAMLRYEALTAEQVEAKRRTAEAMKDLYSEKERLAELDPSTAAAVERGVKEINEIHHHQHELTRQIEILAKQLDASASATDQKQREVDEAKLRTRHKREEMDETRAATKVTKGEAAEARKHAAQTAKLAAKAGQKTTEAEAERVKAEEEKAALKAKADAVEVEVAAAKRRQQLLARERDALAAQQSILAKDEREKVRAPRGGEVEKAE